MLILDLDSPSTPKKQIRVVVEKLPEPIPVVPPKNPIVKEVIEPVHAPKLEVNQKEKLLRKLEEEDHYLRHLRAVNHRRFFDQLGPDLRPLPRADFSEVYEEQRVYRERLKSVFLKKQQLEKNGRLDQPKYMTDSELARLGALKHDRSNAYKLINKLKKKLDEAKIKNKTTRMAELEQKLDQASMKVMEYAHEIDKIVKNGVVS